MCGAASSAFKVLGKRLNRSQGRNPRNKTGITTTVVQCTSCKLIFSNPQPIPESILDHYNTLPENYWNERYFEIEDGMFQEEILWLQQLIKVKPGLKALDVGAGIGKCMTALERAGYETYGIEPSESFYEMAVEKVGINPQSLQRTTVEEAEFPEGFFDVITFGAVLEHLYDPADCLEKAMKWLKPSGVLHIEVPSSQWLISKILNSYYRLIGTDYVVNISPMHSPYHLYEFSLKSFQEFCKNKGYKIADYKFWTGRETFLPGIFDFFLMPIMRRTNTGMQLKIWLKKSE